MRKEGNGVFGEEQSSVSVKERLAKYFAYWPLFVVCIILGVSGGILQAKYTMPKYIATTTFIVKAPEGGKGGSNDLVQSAMNAKKELNINNELLILFASNLMERTVAKNNFNTLYYKKGHILDIEIYKAAPIILTAKVITDSNRSYEIYIKKCNREGGIFFYGPPKAEKKYSFTWNEPFAISNQVFVLSPKANLQNNDGEYIVRWEPVSLAAVALSIEFNAKQLDPKTDAIQLYIKVENLDKGVDVLNALFTEFNQSDIEDRNKLSQTTVQFIDERLLNITRELKGVEGNLENYQGSNQLIDLKGQSSQSMSNSNIVSKNIQELGVQQGVVSMISEYFANPMNGGKLVPSSLGLNDPTLATLITQYNEMQLKKEREAPLVAPNSTVMQDLNTQIENLKSSILESLNNLSKNLRLQERNFQRQSNQYQSMLSAVPHNERVMQEIKRKQSITEGLYLYLFQKREEAAISSTSSSVTQYKQIDSAKGRGPVEPKKNNIIMYATLLGVFVAFGIVSIKELLNDKITSRDDIIKRTSLPLMGQISHISNRKKQGIEVQDRNVIGEQFRALRTNISFLLKDKSKKTILVTSTISHEGKSFISLNLAAVFAMPGKKVALLEFDIRQPVIAANLNLDYTKGLTDYLVGEVNSLAEIRQVSKDIPGLHLYFSGPIPQNPGDLLLTENLGRLLTALKAEYDYIIIDTPPAGLVSDSIVLGEFSEMVLFVVRNQKTAKKQIDFINEMVENKSLNNVAIILNDVKKGDSYGYGGDYNYGNLNGVKKKKKKFSLIG